MREQGEGARRREPSWDEAYVAYVLRPGYEHWQRRYWTFFFELERAHLVALVRAGWLSPSQAGRIAAGLDRVEKSSLEQEPYRGDVEDLFFAIEQRLRQEVGEVADNLHLARSRNDIDVTLYRMDLRRSLLDLHQRMEGLAQALLAQARAHLHTVMPGYTHGQQAQPTTMAHYLAAVLANVERSRRRLESTWPEVNASPLGAAAFTTSGFYIDRRLLAELLGFDGLVRNAYDAVASTDYVMPLLAECSTLAGTLSRFTADLTFWAANEVAGVRLADAFVQVSSIMPNKRNPVVLEHIRSRLGRVPGLFQQACALHANVSFADINDTEDNLQPVWHEAEQLLGEATELLARAVSSLDVDVEVLRRRAREGMSTVTELADTLVREAGLSFRQAHGVVSRLVKLARERELAPHRWSPALLDEAARHELGRSVALSPAALEEALDPVHFVEVRRTLGGPAPGEVAAGLDELAEEIAAGRRWREERLDRLEQASRRLAQEATEWERGNDSRQKMAGE
ncbi:argininosuccinate lyase [Carboxydochorda subterranea]|uniref:Argininosuccinate lyase n=1 Tax=Carboxydichorda subterranea TaxID=3109565 RepID=A0ABZ1BTQ9_9FIRM|nr:argininosuccinate lyase [Limnochorda sp. L945t]WRP16026.1 argininosuccinate lyase [Limnochorda sp. L945t]